MHRAVTHGVTAAVAGSGVAAVATRLARPMLKSGSGKETEMFAAYAAMLWQSDPLGGVLTFGTGGLLAWMLVAAMVGITIASLREHGDARSV